MITTKEKSKANCVLLTENQLFKLQIKLLIKLCTKQVPPAITKPSACRDHEFETQHKSCKQNENEAQDSHTSPSTKKKFWAEKFC